MKRMCLILGFVMVFVSACTAETLPILIPFSEEPTERLTEEDTGKSLALFDRRSSMEVSVISPSLLQADEWLYSWAKESVTRDNVESHSGWIGEWLERARLMYANGFVASERRCAEGRDELTVLMETHAASLRQMRSDDIWKYRMAVAHTLWQTLPEGDANCSAYLSELPIEDFMPVIVSNLVQYAFGGE